MSSVLCYFFLIFCVFLFFSYLLVHVNGNEMEMKFRKNGTKKPFAVDISSTVPIKIHLLKVFPVLILKND